MKKTLMILLFITTCTLASYAQLEKGAWLTGGSGSFYSYSQEYVSTGLNQTREYTAIDLNSTIGYFVINKLSIGLKPSFRYFRGKPDENGSGTTSATQYLLGPYARYYFLSQDNPFNIVSEIDYQFGILKDISSNPNKNGKTNSFSALIGTEIFFNNTAGLDLLFGYRQTYEGFINDPSVSVNYMDKRRGLYMAIGFKIHLEKK